MDSATIIQIIISIILALLSFFCYEFIYKTWKTNRENYSIIWKSISNLKPDHLLGLRASKLYGFRKYYYERSHDKIIKKKIEKGENILVLGGPISGKTRTVYEVLKRCDKNYYVIIPKRDYLETKGFRVPLFFSFLPNVRKRRILILDDIQKFSVKQNFKFLIEEFRRRNIPIIATCRLGPEKDEFSKSELSYIFNDPEEITKLQKDEAKKIANEAGEDFPERFDGNIGSIFLPLETMEKRFKECTDVEKGILRSIKRLYRSGIYEEREVFSVNRIKKVCLVCEKIKQNGYEFRNFLDNLEKNGFIKRNKEKIQIEEAYLDFIIEDDEFTLEDFREMLDIFSGDPEALYDLGDRAYDIGEISLDIADLMKVAIEAFEGALKVWTKKANPTKYGRAKNGLGISYGRLSEVEKRIENVKKAIEAFNDILKVMTLDKYPIDYAGTQNNLGLSYRTLSEVVDKEKNAKLAIKACNEALNVYTLDRYPFYYAMTQNNLGIAYWKLSEVLDREKNAKLAIEAYNEALKVRTIDRFPADYAMTQNNLGGTYSKLSEVVDTKKNAKLAIKAHNEALKVYTLDRFPTYFAMTQNNLGIAYWKLSEVLDREKNAKLAIKAFNEALKVYALNRFPIQYAMTHGSIGNLYGSLAKAGNRAENCRRAREAYGEAMKVFIEAKAPELIQQTERNIQILNEICKEE